MFDERASKNMHILSKIIYIVTKIVSIFCYIGLAGLFLCLVVIPIVFGHIDTKNSTLKVGDKTYTYKLTKDKLTIYDGSDKVVSEKVNIDVDLQEIISKHPSSYYLGVFESMIGIAAICVIFVILLLRHVAKFFKNISKDETPFTSDNIDHLKQMAKYLLIMVLFSTISYGIVNAVAGLDLNMRINFTEILYALIIICMAYVFCYGYDLEHPKKTVKEKSTKKSVKEK